MRIIETQHSQAYTHSGRVRTLLVHKISTQAVASGAPTSYSTHARGVLDANQILTAMRGAINVARSNRPTPRVHNNECYKLLDHAHTHTHTLAHT